MTPIPVHHDNTDPDFLALIELITGEMRRLSVPGVAVGLWHDGRAQMAGLGITSVENPLPVTADTLFQIGSTTKTFTGTAIMRLVEQGLIDLDEPVRTYVPDLRLMDKAAQAEVTVRHLLTHMGGWAGDYFSETGSGEDALIRYVAEMASLPQVVPVGTLWSYNNAGFSLAGRVIETVTGESFEDAMQQLVFDPLGLTNSYFYANDVISRRFAVGHRVDDENGAQVERPWALTRSAHAAGGISSTVRDQLIYARFHLGDGTAASGERLLSESTLQAMQTALHPANLGREMGLSWLLKRIDDTPIVMHGGATNGQLSAFLMVPSRDFAITILTNAEEGGLLHDKAVSWALDHYLGLREPELAHLPRTAAELAPYTGSYDALMTKLDLYVDGETLMMQATPKGGFPDKDSPASPPPPPSRVSFFGNDTIVALDEPMINTKAEFIRDRSGRIEWLRTSRLHRRL
jgi:CubicO group peptidase (beta-lactamase class C family)